jgi:nucleotide-binding universal stress UspA family protein
LEVAEETNADVIAMSTHGRSGVQRWLMGSVAEKVVHHSHIPVMLIHPN